MNISIPWWAWLMLFVAFAAAVLLIVQVVSAWWHTREPRTERQDVHYHGGLRAPRSHVKTLMPVTEGWTQVELDNMLKPGSIIELPSDESVQEWRENHQRLLDYLRTKYDNVLFDQGEGI
jgi:hypothetical protein